MKNAKWILPLIFSSLGFSQRPGDRQPVSGVNPAYSLELARPTAVSWAIGAMDFMADGRMVVASWRDPYEVYILSNAIVGSTPRNAAVTRFATGLSEVLGLKVVNDSIYVLEKDALTLLLDQNGDGTADEYRAIAYDWTKSVNEKEYAVGLAFDGTYFYGIFGDPTINSGTSIDPQPAGRVNGSLRIRKSDGLTEPFTAGMRVPGGIGQAYGEIWVSEVQGGFRVANVLYNLRQGRYYGRPVNPPPPLQTQPYNANPYTSADQSATIYTPFSASIPFKNTSAAGGGPVGLTRMPTNPLMLSGGPYSGQLIVPEADREAGGEMTRIFLERMANGEYQGAVFHFSRNTAFEGSGVFNAKYGPDGRIYTVGNGSDAAGWGRVTNVGMNRMTLTGTIPFDILAVRSMGGSTFEFQFTKPLAASLGNDVTANLVAQKWWDQISNTYGCCRRNITTLTVASATVQSDRSRVLVTINGLTLRWTYHFRWTDNIRSETNEILWGTESFYNLNAFGPGTTPVPVENRFAVGERPFTVARDAQGLRVNLDIPSDAAYEVRVLDLRGRLVASRSGRGGGRVNFTFDLLPPGICVLKVRTGAREYSRLIPR